MEKSMTENLGKLGRDKVTGFEGIITGIVKHLYGCDSYVLTPKVNDGKQGKIDNFDKGRVEIIEEGISTSEIQTEKPFDIENLGKFGRDKVTGFEGIITAIAKKLYGSDNYFLTSKYKDGDIQGSFFDKGRIEIIDEGIQPSEVQSDKPGGVDLSAFFN